MADFLIIPAADVDKYRRRSVDGLYAIEPIKLDGRDAYALPLAVLDNPEFAALVRQGAGIADQPSREVELSREALTVDKFEWHRQRDDTDTGTGR